MTVPFTHEDNISGSCPCGQTTDPADRFCRACGRAIGEATWFEKPLVVVTLLFFVIGPLALPLLWRSTRFSLPAKLVLSLLCVGMLFWGLYAIANMPLESLIRVIG